MNKKRKQINRAVDLIEERDRMRESAPKMEETYSKFLESFGKFNNSNDQFEPKCSNEPQLQNGVRLF